MMKFPMDAAKVSILNWSEWKDVSSLDDGISSARGKIGYEWIFKGTEKNAAAYADLLDTTAIAEVRNNGSATSKKWQYRVRIENK
jgi:hypothetical protein